MQNTQHTPTGTVYQTTKEANTPRKAVKTGRRLFAVELFGDEDQVGPHGMPPSSLQFHLEL